MDPSRVHWMVEEKTSTLDGMKTMTTSVLSRLHEIREAYARRRSLWRELSEYITADDLNDIEAAVDRCDDDGTDPQTEELRRILAAQRSLAARGTARRP